MQTITTKNWIPRLLALLGAVITVQTSLVNAEVNVSDIESVLEPFPGSEIVNEFAGAVTDYSLALGRMEKVRDIWGPERERRLAGALQRKTIQIPEGHSAQEAYDFYKRKIRNYNPRILYECQARNCGSSSAWANEQFEDKTLYGLDNQQNYSIYEVADDEGLLNYLALYSVVRGNRRVYAHTEWLRTVNKADATVAPSAEEVSNNLRENGFYLLSGLSLNNDQIDIDAEHLQAIVNAIRINRRMNIRVVGHNYAAVSLEQQQQLSFTYAEQVVKLLTDNGVAAQRLSAHGVGSLAPARSARGNVDGIQAVRIELVVSN